MNFNRPKIQLNIRTALSITTLFFIIVPLLSLTTTLIIHSSESTTQSFITNTNGLNQIAVSFLEEKINTYNMLLDSIIEHNDLDKTIGENYDTLHKKFQEHAATNPSILNIYFYNYENEFIQTLNDELPEGIIFYDRPWFKDAISQNGNLVIGYPYSDILTGNTIFSLSKSIEKNGQPIGVLALDINLSILATELECIQYGVDGELIVTTQDGLVLISRDHELLSTSVPTEYSTWDEILSNPSGQTQFTYNDISYKATYSTSELTGWKFILKMPTNELHSFIYHMLFTTIVITILVVVICIIIMYFISNKVDKSLGSIPKHIELIASGVFDTPLSLNTFLTDFSFLAEHLNIMQTDISKLMMEFSTSIDQLTTHTDSCLNESETIASSMEQINGTIHEIANGTSESANNLVTISNHMDNLSNHMEQFKQTVESISNMAHKTSELGQAGSDISNTVKLSSSQTKASTLEVKDAIQEVVNNIEAISIMSSTISAITEQTNLLALNATIEAARAGEAGKGFSVVASEISKLADETAISAQKITEVVKSIEYFVTQAVEKVNTTTHIVDSQEDAIEQSQVIFSDIIDFVNQFSEKASEIAKELGTVNEMKDDVLEQVESLSSILTETAAGTEEVSSSTTVVQNSSEHFVNNLSELSSMSDSLRKHMNKFKF